MYTRNAASRDGHAYRCKPCERARYDSVQEDVRRRARAAYHRRLADGNRDEIVQHERARLADYRVRMRAELHAAYGGRCACCGEARPEFLTIDHIYGDGASERRATRRFGLALARWLRSRG
jgi:hypothetical protein